MSVQAIALSVLYLWATCLTSLYYNFFICKGDNDSIYIIQVFVGLNQIKYIKCLEKDLVLNKC